MALPKKKISKSRRDIVLACKLWTDFGTGRPSSGGSAGVGSGDTGVSVVRFGGACVLEPVVAGGAPHPVHAIATSTHLVKRCQTAQWWRARTSPSP